MATSIFKVQVQVNTKGVGTGTKKVNAGLKKVKANADQARVSIGRMFAVMVAVQVVRNTVRLLADFEQSISTVSAVTGAAAADMAKLTAEAERLGITTRFSAKDAADGMVFLARAGFTVTETLSAVGDTLRLAQAGGLDLARAAEITADTLRAFNIEAADTVRVVDVLAKASNASNTNVTQLGQALKFVAPIARGMGISLEETTAALAKLADAGQKASIGGTGLRRVMAALESPTAKAKRTLTSLGLSTEDVQISSVGLTTALANLARAGITTSEIFQLFGRRSGTSAAVLLANVGAVENMEEALKNAGGTAKAMAKIMDDNLNGAMFRASSAMKGFAISLGQSGLSTVLVGIMEGLASAFRFLGESAAVVTPVLAAMTAALVFSMIPAVVKLTAKMGLLNSAILLNPYVLSGAAIVGAIVAVAGAYAKLNAEIAATQSALDAEVKLSLSGKKLVAIRKEINTVEKLYANGMVKEEGLLESLRAKEKKLTDTLFEKNKQTQLNLKAQAELKPSTDNIIAGITRQIKALGELTDAERVAEKVAKAVARIRQSDKEAVVTPADKERLRLGFEQLALAEKMAKVVESIRGPQREAESRAKAFTLALKLGKISLKEYNQAMLDINETLGRTTLDNPFKAQLDSIKKGNDELRLRTQFFGAELQFRMALLTLGKSAEDLSAKELQDLTSAITANQTLLNILRKQKAEVTGSANKAAAARQEEEATAGRLNALLREVDITGRLEQKREDLESLKARGLISNNQLALSLENLQLQALETSTALGDGFERAFIKMNREANDFAAVGESIVNVFADQATNALIKFAETGKFAFKDFANAILKDITRIIARLLVMQAISAAAGGLGLTGAASPGISAASQPFFRASGGAAQKDRSFIVGENGPELFTPNQSGNISPAGTTKGMTAEAPVVNVQVTNVTDPDEVPQAINDGGADDAIVNVISRNRDKIKGIL